jgi:hypothetical protein
MVRSAKRTARAARTVTPCEARHWVMAKLSLSQCRQSTASHLHPVVMSSFDR